MLITNKECANCKATTNKTAIRLMADGEQWWHFSNYKTKVGNVYSGLFCPECSETVYKENKLETDIQCLSNQTPSKPYLCKP